jgi:hypothetical protein
VSQPNQTGDRLKIPPCTREYPPEVYGGAGVHVEYMANGAGRCSTRREADRPVELHGLELLGLDRGIGLLCGDPEASDLADVVLGPGRRRDHRPR